MKRKNLLNNIATTIVQIIGLVWVLVCNNTNIGYAVVLTTGGTISFILLVLLFATTGVINLLVGLANNKESKAKLILNVIIFPLLILQPILLYMDY